jgi:hypothetical protein
MTMAPAFEIFRDPPAEFRGMSLIVPRDWGEFEGRQWTIEDYFVPAYKYPDMDKPFLMRFWRRVHYTTNPHWDKEDWQTCTICQQHGREWNESSTTILLESKYGTG